MINLSTNHKELFQADMEILIEVENHLDPAYLDKISSQKLKDTLYEMVLPKLFRIQHPVAAENIFGMALAHPMSIVRHVLIDVVQSWLPYHSAVETIIRLTRDPDDLVCFKAIDVCGDEKIELSVGILSPIIKTASASINNGGKPVGIGAAKVIKSLVNIFETNDPVELALLEHQFETKGIVRNRWDYVESIPSNLTADLLSQNPNDMIYIPEGLFKYGVEYGQVPDQTFAWKDSVPSYDVWLPSFLIDKYPITNEQYDEFVADVKENGHRFCHLNEPHHKDHTRNTFWDKRFKPNDPVGGIDWYDAYAYARWAGKELPTEFQWEKAARGPEGNVWPWGNEFDEEKVNWAKTTFGRKPNDMSDWRTMLTSVTEDSPSIMVREASQLESKGNVSPYGVVGMVGNIWEWTRSDYGTRRFFSPEMGHKITKFHTSAVLKGGSFTSLVGQMYPSFRGLDAAFCRHNEMGFRLVTNIPIWEVRKALGHPIKNSAIY